MSLIYGCLALPPQASRPINTELLQSMRASLNLGWTPDCEQIWHADNCYLGQQSLHNTPESRNETLPRRDSESGYVIIADARIDNRPELSHQLGLSLEAPDSEFILASYKKWQKECVHYLIGDFAFVIWDPVRQNLFCARDHLGVKPLFYCQHQGHFYFSSLQRALNQLPFIDSKLSEQKALSLLLPSPRWDERTCFEQIKRLPPAHTLQITPGDIQLTHYWQAATQIQDKPLLSNDEYLHNFEQILQRAVTDRLRSNHPIAAQVSGGLDSSGILALATSVTKKNVQSLYTYTHGLSKQCKARSTHLSDELSLASKVCDFTGSRPPQKVTMADENYLDLIDKVLQLNGGPIYRGAMTIPTYLLCQAASRDSATTMLSGFPGDEAVTAGSGQFIELAFQDRQVGTLAKYSLRHPRTALAWGVKRLLTVFPHRQHEALLVKQFYKQFFGSGNIFKEVAPEKMLPASLHSVGGQLRFPEHIFNRWDRIISAHVMQRFESEYTAAACWGMEPRYPLADIRLIEFYHSLPVHMKRQKNMGRWIFRKTMEDKLPQDVVWMDKSNVSAVPGMLALRTANTAQIQSYLRSRQQTKTPDYLNLTEIMSRFEAINQGLVGGGKERGHGGILDLAMQLLRYDQLQ